MKVAVITIHAPLPDRATRDDAEGLADIVRAHALTDVPGEPPLHVYGRVVSTQLLPAAIVEDRGEIRTNHGRRLPVGDDRRDR